MRAGYLLDEFLNATPPGTIAERQDFIKTNYNRYGFTPKTAAIIGGGALALAGMDGRVEFADRLEIDLFDLDVVVPQAILDRLYQEAYVGLPRGHGPLRHFRNPDDPHMDAFSRLDDPKGYVEFADLLTDSVVIDGCRTVLPIRAAQLRLQMPIRRGKAALGVVKAHASAHRQGLVIAQDPAWQQVVADACRIARNRPPAEHTAWFDQLAESEGGMAAHPAFAFMAQAA